MGDLGVPSVSPLSPGCPLSVPRCPQYPEWLRQHEGSLSPEQRERFRAQQGLMLRICAELERERPGEPEGQRRERFETLLDLMQQVRGGRGDPKPARPRPDPPPCPSVPSRVRLSHPVSLCPLLLSPHSCRTWATLPRSWRGTR